SRHPAHVASRSFPRGTIRRGLPRRAEQTELRNPPAHLTDPMRYARILSKLYSQPLLLQPSAWHAFDHALRDVMETGRIQLPRMPAARIHDDNLDLEGSDDDCRPAAPARMFRGVLELRRLAPAPIVAAIGDHGPGELPNDTAIIHFDGVLDKHISMMDMMCYGGVDLDDIDGALAFVAADAN